MNKLFKFAVAALVVILVTTNSTSAQTRKQRKKPKVTQATIAIEYPADPEDPFYQITVGLPDVDKVELFYVTLRRKDQTPKTQPNTVETEETPFGGIVGNEYQIAAQNTLRGEAAKDFATQWRKLLRGPGAACFAPAYRIKFWAKDQMLLGTDVCYHCRNITTPENGRREIRGFNAEGASGKELLKRLKELLPESDSNRNQR
ncbi:MAG TPA: hypothetical protein VJZ77_16645 [Blastocatellia bacterium]|nr:hypothetical protein [Blastocatellia bacterium]